MNTITTTPATATATASAPAPAPAPAVAAPQKSMTDHASEMGQSVTKSLGKSMSSLTSMFVTKSKTPKNSTINR